jgi:hypothetical protein
MIKVMEHDAPRYAMRATVGGGYVGIASDPGGTVPVGVAIPCGAVEGEGGDLLAVFSLVIGPEQVHGTWTCRGRRFTRIDDSAGTTAAPAMVSPLSSRVPGHRSGTCRSGDTGRN